MNILISNPYFPPYAPGGAEYSLVQMCERFAEFGWSVRVITNCYDGKPRREFQNGYEVEWLQCPVELLPGQQIDASEYLATKGYHESLTNALVLAAGEMGHDTVFIANNAQSFRGTVKAAQIASIPVAGIVRDTQIICEGGACIDNTPADIAIPCSGPFGMARCFLKFLRRRDVRGLRPVPGILAKGLLLGMRRESLRREGLLQLDVIITISDALRSLIAKVPSVHPKRVQTIRNFHSNIIPTSPERVEAFLATLGLAGKRFFLVAGRKTIGKGVDLAVEAAGKIVKSHPDAAVLFLGRERLWITAGANVIDHESVSQELLLGILQAAKALIIPGRWQEGLHRTMIDALHVGVPVICSNVGAPPVDGVLDGRTGFVVPCEDSPALASAMIRILDWTSEQRAACRIASKERYLANFGSELLMTQWATALNQMIEVR